MRSGSLAPRHPLSPPARPIPPNIRTTDVGPVPDPGHPVPPLARAHPCRLQGHRVPAGTPAGMSASRPASARPVAFRPGTRQTPDASPDLPPWPHPIRQIIQADLRVSPGTPVPPRPPPVTHRPKQSSDRPPADRHLPYTRQSPALPGLPRGPSPGRRHIHHRAPPTPRCAPAYLMPVLRSQPPDTPHLL